MLIRFGSTIPVVTTFAVFLATTAAQSNAEDWARWRGPRFDGISRERALLNPWPKDGPKEIWRVGLGGGFSSVAVADGRLFTQTKEGDYEVVLCLDAATGKELWRYRYAADYDAHVTFTSGPRPETRTGPRATPTVDGDRVYVMGATGILVALEAKTGKEIWRRRMLRAPGKYPIADPRSVFPPAEVPMHGISSSPLVVGERLFVVPGGPSGKTVAALDKNDGRVLWEALDDPVGHSSPIWADVHGSPQIIFLTAIAAVGLAPQDGQLLWRFPWKTTFDLNIATPVYADGQVFISSNYGKGGALLRLTKKGEPEMVWESLSMQSHFATSILYEGFLYGFSGARLRSVDFRTGEVKWDTIGFGMGNVIIADGNLIVLGEHGQLALARATPAAYTEISRAQLLIEEKTLTWTVPVVSGRRLFVRHQYGLVALDLKPTAEDLGQLPDR